MKMKMSLCMNMAFKGLSMLCSLSMISASIFHPDIVSSVEDDTPRTTNIGSHLRELRLKTPFWDLIKDPSFSIAPPDGDDNDSSNPDDRIEDTVPDTATAGLVSVYQFQWGGYSIGCEYDLAAVFIGCNDGGVLSIQTYRNSRCAYMSPDIVRCTHVTENEDSAVDYMCLGMTDSQVISTAQVFGNRATSCAHTISTDVRDDNTLLTLGGSAASYGKLSRKCTNDETGAVFYRSHSTCISGSHHLVGGDYLCVSEGICAASLSCHDFPDGVCVGDTSCDIDVASVAISSDHLLMQATCSEPFDRLDMTYVDFTHSTLASYHYVKWEYSESGNGCDWQNPTMILTCPEGGIIELESSNPECTMISPDAIECHRLVPSSTPENANTDYDSVNLMVWCYGTTDQQLLLQVDLPAASTSTCEPEGEAGHSVLLARGCGNMQGTDFNFYFMEEFCNDMNQYLPNESGCGAGSTCSTSRDDEPCESIHVDRVTSSSSNIFDGLCTYVVPAPESTESPTQVPSDSPTETPSVGPTWGPSSTPSAIPSGTPSTSPSAVPSSVPSSSPSSVPTPGPTGFFDRAPTLVLFIEIRFDDYPEQIGVVFTDMTSDTVLLERQPGHYTADHARSELAEVIAGIVSGHTYAVTIQDTAGDGLCCDEPGGYTVLLQDGTIIAAVDGSFSSEETTIFQAP